MKGRPSSRKFSQGSKKSKVKIFAQINSFSSQTFFSFFEKCVKGPFNFNNIVKLTLVIDGIFFLLWIQSFNP